MGLLSVSFWVGAFFYVSAVTSNMILGIPAKSITLLFLVLALWLDGWKKKTRISIVSVKVICLTLAVFGVWGLIGVLNGYVLSMFQQCMKVFTVFFMFYIFDYIYENKTIAIEEMKGIVIKAFGLSVIFKIGLECLYMLKVIDAEQLLELIEKGTGMQVMSLLIADGILCRLGTISDVFALSIFPFVYVIEKRKCRRILIILATIALMIINYSRIYMVQTLVLLFVLLVPMSRVISKRWIKWWLVTMILFIGVGVMFSNIWLTALDGRFIGADAEASDYQRYVQIAYLLEGIKDDFWWGHGFGSFVPGFTRSDDYPFLYEVEILALIYQVGAIGLAMLIWAFVLIIKRAPFKGLSFRYRLLVYINAVFFLLRSLFNPMLFASNSIIVLISMIFLVSIIKKECIND